MVADLEEEIGNGIKEEERETIVEVGTKISEGGIMDVEVNLVQFNHSLVEVLWME